MVLLNFCVFLSIYLSISHAQEPVVTEYENGQRYAVWHEKFAAKGMYRNFPIVRSNSETLEVQKGSEQQSLQSSLKQFHSDVPTSTVEQTTTVKSLDTVHVGSERFPFGLSTVKPILNADNIRETSARLNPIEPDRQATIKPIFDDKKSQIDAVGKEQTTSKLSTIILADTRKDSSPFATEPTTSYSSTITTTTKPKTNNVVVKNKHLLPKLSEAKIIFEADTTTVIPSTVAEIYTTKISTTKAILFESLNTSKASGNGRLSPNYSRIKTIIVAGDSNTTNSLSTTTVGTERFSQDSKVINRTFEGKRTAEKFDFVHTEAQIAAAPKFNPNLHQFQPELPSLINQKESERVQKPPSYRSASTDKKSSLNEVNLVADDIPTDQQLLNRKKGIWHFNAANDTDLSAGVAPTEAVTKSDIAPSWSNWGSCNSEGKRIRTWMCDAARKVPCQALQAIEEQFCQPGDFPDATEDPSAVPILPVKPADLPDFARKFSIPTEPPSTGVTLEFVTELNHFSSTNEPLQLSTETIQQTEATSTVPTDNSQTSTTNFTGNQQAVQSQITADANQPTVPPQVTVESNQPTVRPQATVDANQPAVPTQVTGDINQPTVPPQVAADTNQPTVSPQVTVDNNQPTVQPQDTTDVTPSTAQPQVTVVTQPSTLSPQQRRSNSPVVAGRSQVARKQKSQTQRPVVSNGQRQTATETTLDTTARPTELPPTEQSTSNNRPSTEPLPIQPDPSQTETPVDNNQPTVVIPQTPQIIAVQNQPALPPTSEFLGVNSQPQSEQIASGNQPQIPVGPDVNPLPAALPTAPQQFSDPNGPSPIPLLDNNQPNFIPSTVDNRQQPPFAPTDSQSPSDPNFSNPSLAAPNDQISAGFPPAISPFDPTRQFQPNGFPQPQNPPFPPINQPSQQQQFGRQLTNRPPNARPGLFANNNDEFLLPNGYILSLRKFKGNQTAIRTTTIDPNIE